MLNFRQIEVTLICYLTHQIKTHVQAIKNRNLFGLKKIVKMTDTVEEKVVNRKRKMSKGKCYTFVSSEARTESSYRLKSCTEIRIPDRADSREFPTGNSREFPEKNENRKFPGIFQISREFSGNFYSTVEPNSDENLEKFEIF